MTQGNVSAIRIGDLSSFNVRYKVGDNADFEHLFCSIEKIIRFLKKNLEITDLSFMNQKLYSEDFKNILHAIKDHKISRLNVTNINMGADGAKLLAEYIKSHPSLTLVLLSHNAIGNEGAAAIAESLKWSNVRGIDIGSNAITIGVKSLIEAVKTSLITSMLTDNNHFTAEYKNQILFVLGVNRKVLKFIEQDGNADEENKIVFYTSDKEDIMVHFSSVYQTYINHFDEGRIPTAFMQYTRFFKNICDLHSHQFDSGKLTSLALKLFASQPTTPEENDIHTIASTIFKLANTISWGVDKREEDGEEEALLGDAGSVDGAGEL